MTDEKRIEELEAEESMFVQTAEAITSDADLAARRQRVDALLLRPAAARRRPHEDDDFVDCGTRVRTASRRTRRTPCSPSLSPATRPPRTPWW